MKRANRHRSRKRPGDHRHHHERGNAGFGQLEKRRELRARCERGEGGGGGLARERQSSGIRARHLSSPSEEALDSPLAGSSLGSLSSEAIMVGGGDSGA